MLTSHALAALQGAKIDKKDWRDVSGIVAEILQSRAWRDEYPTPTAWLEAASEVSGYSSAILRRMCAVRSFLENVKDDFGAPQILTDNTTRAPIATMEILKRVHDIDAGKAKELFDKILLGKVSHREVQATYQDMLGPSPFTKGPGQGPMGLPRDSATNLSMGNKFGKRAAHEFLQAAAGAIENKLQVLTQDAQARFYFQQFKFNFASPDAVALRLKGNGIEWIDAFDMRYMTGALPRRKRNQLLAEVAFGATFFRNYWVIIEKRGALAQSLAKDARFLELHSVGVAEFELEKPEKLHVLLRPELPAEPDRQAVGITDVMQQGIPDLVNF
jgi:hypothetical protein